MIILLTELELDLGLQDEYHGAWSTSSDTSLVPDSRRESASLK